MGDGQDEAAHETLDLIRRPDAKLDAALTIPTRMVAPPSKTEPGG